MKKLFLKILQIRHAIYCFSYYCHNGITDGSKAWKCLMRDYDSFVNDLNIRATYESVRLDPPTPFDKHANMLAMKYKEKYGLAPIDPKNYVSQESVELGVL